MQVLDDLLALLLVLGYFACRVFIEVYAMLCAAVWWAWDESRAALRRRRERKAATRAMALRSLPPVHRARPRPRVPPADPRRRP